MQRSLRGFFAEFEEKMFAVQRECQNKLVAKINEVQMYREKCEREREKYQKLKESWKLYSQQVASPPIVAVIANVNCDMPANDEYSNDKSLEGVDTSYKDRLGVLTSELDALKKELTF
jgi:hypothetical protein